MPTGSCIKCQTLPILNDSSSKLIIAFEVLELSKKFINYLEDENINYKKEDNLTIIIQTSSLFTFLPLATLNTYSNKSLDKVSRLTPSTNSPQLKSIQFFLFEYNPIILTSSKNLSSPTGYEWVNKYTDNILPP